VCVWGGGGSKQLHPCVRTRRFVVQLWARLSDTELPCSLSEELVSASQTAEQHATAWRDLERVRQEYAQVGSSFHLV